MRLKSSFVGLTALLVGGGAVAGTLISGMTSSAIVWRAAPKIPVTEAVAEAAVDQTSAGQAWARSAYDGGLRRCPEINPEFLAACQAEIKALSERPAFAAGSYGGPLLITKVIREPEIAPYKPEPIEPLRADEPQRASFDVDPDGSVLAPPTDKTPDHYPAAAQEQND